ncbi:alkaline phosphatase-like protein [Dothidotthia symphoricarpi CBS 119687]|uniref:Alkaline phosphatase-like protein n=1 Tax=Dothidotthia symphoricarpi CBS 119687 TaxID=1392245 RepID=A0A6A6AEG8_9PLEO|nr:alkaline phosphatase-like protein [Dothidotthia symphoricarpi CBS 119687]KAF2129693.1 alkaline phosphatase-like protein [Dothidotthia symphoricarpi CBS 119687]
MSKDPNRPNIVLILADNLGWGELGCYGGGALRGAATPRIDDFATSGLLLHNFNVESDCVPTRSALMTGRHPIRTGCKQSVPAGQPQGLTPWENTLPECLRKVGYATAHHGKWHLGDVPGRYPSDRGFDEWFGIPRTTDESQFTSAVGFDAEVAELPYIMQGVTGQASEEVCVYDLEKRRLIDEMLVEKSKDWLSRKAASEAPFFLYHPLVHLHFPTLPHPDFARRTGNGDFADSMAEMDFRVGQLLDHIDELGIRKNTVVIFASDNGPEFRPPYRGTAGPWSGTYHTAMEGSLRVPFIIRWPGQVPENITSNEMVHVTDIFTSVLAMAGVAKPSDRPIDGFDQVKFFQNPTSVKSEREGFLFYIKDDLRAIKWRHWKLHLVWEPKVNQSSGQLESPYLFNVMRDPKEESDILAYNTWVLQPMMKLKASFLKSLKSNPAPVDPMKDL